MKTITIDGKSYEIECNAFTYILHRKIFNRGIMQDMKILQDYITLQIVETNKVKKKFPKISNDEAIRKISDCLNKHVDAFIEAITRITYTLIKTANENIEDYEKFLRNIKTFKTNDKWIVEVTEIAVDCFC